MINIETVLIEFVGLRAEELDRWIAETYIRPEGEPGAWRFRDIDIARLRLLIDLRDTCDIPEPAFPTVLSLIDQLYDLRRRVRSLNAAMETALPADVRAALLRQFEAL